MKLIHTNDGRYYRRWVNLIPSLLFPGAAQFLSGRSVAGIIWFVTYAILLSAMIGFLVYPKTPYSVVQMGPFDWFFLPLWLLIAGDGLRRPILCLGFRRWALFLFIGLGIPVLSALAVRSFLIQPFNVPSGGMQPTIMGNRTDAEGNQVLCDHIFVNKLIYRSSEPQRGDVIVFRTQGLRFVKQDTFYVKRLVGLPGETIRIDPPYVMVNDNRLLVPSIFQEITEKSGYNLAISNSTMAGCLSSPTNEITLSPEEYLVMGDNTRNSLDGRFFGPIKRSAVLGKAFYIYAPASRKKMIR